MLCLNLPKYKTIEQMARQNPDCISFSQGAVKVGGTPQVIKNFVSQMLKSDLVDYYQPVAGLDLLREKLASVLSEKHGTKISSANVLVSHGAIGALSTICLTLLGQGDEVLLPEPSYPSYLNVVTYSKALPKFVPAYLEDENGWRFEMDAIHEATTSRTRMIILSNPSNPCGVCLNFEEFIALKSWCEKHSIYLVIDEVYENFIFEKSLFSSTAMVLESDFIIRTGSFSKDYAMSGWRVGFAVCSEKIIQNLIAVQDGTLCCPNVIGQYAALFALQQTELVVQLNRKVRESRDLACSGLKELVKEGLISFTKPNAGIFLWIKTPFEDSEEFVMKILREANVALVPGKDFGPSGASYFRLCYAREPDLVVEGVQRLVQFMLECHAPA